MASEKGTDAEQRHFREHRTGLSKSEKEHSFILDTGVVSSLSTEHGVPANSEGILQEREEVQL